MNKVRKILLEKFQDGKLKLKCVAILGDLFLKTNEVSPRVKFCVSTKCILGLQLICVRRCTRVYGGVWRCSLYLFMNVYEGVVRFMKMYEGV